MNHVVLRPPNTFIGGVSSVISSSAGLSPILGVPLARITNFSVVGADIQCNISGTYLMNDSYLIWPPGFSYFDDRDGLSLRTTYVRNYSNLYYWNTPNSTPTGYFGRGCPLLKEAIFPNTTTLIDSAFYESLATKFYVPNSTTLGVNPALQQVFYLIQPGSTIYCHPSLATSNSGSEEGDIAYARTSRGATIVYVTNYTPPNPITDLSAGTIYNSKIQLNFTTPSSTNTIGYYKCYVDGVFKNQIPSSGNYVSGLLPTTNYNITVKSVDVFLNESPLSNILNVSTNSTPIPFPMTGLVSYYKLDSNSSDSFGSNHGTDTSVSYVSGKISSAGSYNGTTSKSIVGNPPNLQLSSGTISCWVKSSSAGSGYRSIFGKINAYNLFLFDGVLVCYNWGSFGGSGNKSTGVNLNDGLWHHIVLVFDSGVTNGSQIYLDGVLKLTFSMSVLNQTDNVCIGASNTIQYINALIDEACIHNVKLTQTEIDLLYNGGAGTTL